MSFNYFFMSSRPERENLNPKPHELQFLGCTGQTAPRTLRQQQRAREEHGYRGPLDCKEHKDFDCPGVTSNSSFPRPSWIYKINGETRTEQEEVNMPLQKDCQQCLTLAVVIKQNSGNITRRSSKLYVTSPQCSTALTAFIPPFFPTPETAKEQPSQNTDSNAVIQTQAFSS